MDVSALHATSVGPHNEKSTIFQSQRMAEYMLLQREVFTSILKLPSLHSKDRPAYVFQINSLSDNDVVLLTQAIMEIPSYETIRDTLLHFKRELPGFQPYIVNIPYCRQQLKAWAEVYNCVIRFYYFEYILAIMKKVQKLGLTYLLQNNHEVRSLVRSFLAIPLLPHQMMLIGFYMLFVRAEYLGVLDVLLSFLNYFMDTWMKGFRYETLSVFNQANRTNNASEVAQRTLSKETGPHCLTNRQLIDAMRRCECASYECSRTRVSVAHCQKVSTLKNDMLIKNCTQELLAGNITLKRFLRVTSTQVMRVFHESLHLHGLV